MIRSLNVDPNRRRFRCNYSNCPGNRGGTFFELYRLVKQMEPEECAQALCNELGVQLELVGAEEGLIGIDKDRKEVIQDLSSDGKETLLEAQEDHEGSAQEFDDVAPSPVEEIVAESSDVDEFESEPGEESLSHVSDAEPSPGIHDFNEYLDAATNAFESNKYRKARDDFNRALKHAPGMEERIHCEVMLARCMIHLKKTNEALDILQRTSEDSDLAEDAQKEVLYRMAEAYERMGQPDKAVEVLGRLIQKHGAYRDSDSRLIRLKQQKPDTGETQRDQRISFI